MTYLFLLFIPTTRNPKGKRSTEECEFEKPIHCDDGAKYRTYDGSCNNLKYPYWGKAETPLARFLKSDYHDGKQFIFFFHILTRAGLSWPFLDNNNLI